LASIEYYATGRRKTSTARVFLRPGSGTITVNHREFDKYFTTDQLRTQVRRPLLLTETGDKFDILATVDGGGEIAVKKTNEFNDQYHIMISDGHIRRGDASYRATCYPAWF